MIIVSNEELELICKKIVVTAKSDYPMYYPHIYLLYKTGCRIGEVFDFRMHYNEERNTINIIAQKKNYVREIPVDETFNLELLNRLINRQDLFYLNIRNLQRTLKKLMPISNIFCGKKNIGAHIFRHNYIRKLLADGKTIEEINEHMGYTRQTVEDTYLSAIIYY
jgi:integrase